MAAKGTRLRFELGRLEVAGVVVSTAAGLFVVFLLGIYAGRGMAERRLELDEQMVRIPVDTEQASTQENELTFYETLAREEEPAPQVQDDAEPAARDRMNEVVSGAVIAEEDLPSRDEAPVAKPAPQAVAKAEPKAKPEPKSEPKAKAKPALKDEPRVAMALVDEEPAAPARPKATGGDWSVQVAATRDPRHAESIKRQLTTAGYRAYIVQTRRQGETFHRVRVGRYPSMDEARQVASLLRDQPGVTGAFVASD